jgi:hypothetical protein
MVHLAKVEINRRRFAPILDHITGITTSPEYAVWQRFGQNGPFAMRINGGSRYLIYQMEKCFMQLGSQRGQAAASVAI